VFVSSLPAKNALLISLKPWLQGIYQRHCGGFISVLSRKDAWSACGQLRLFTSRGTQFDHLDFVRVIIARGIRSHAENRFFGFKVRLSAPVLNIFKLQNCQTADQTG
jgi:hypothetical protein